MAIIATLAGYKLSKAKVGALELITRTFTTKNNVFYSLALIVPVTVLYFFLPARIAHLVLQGYGVFAVTAFVSNMLGILFYRKSIKFVNAPKTIIQVLTFFTTLVVILLSSILEYYEGLALSGDFIYQLLVAGVIAILLTAVYTISGYKELYFIIPAVLTYLIYVLAGEANYGLVINLYIGVIISGAVAYLSYRAKFLTASGAVATFVLAGFIFGFGSLKWSVPIMAFFLLSSILSKVRKKANAVVESYFEKSGTRDYMQVIANGGVGGLLILVYTVFPNEILFYMYVASLAAVCADTWSTEFGTMKKFKTYSVLTLRPLPQGMSGGISIQGTLGGVLGAVTIALSGLYWSELLWYVYIPLIVISAITGSFLDSILGATVQAQYKCNRCSKITERVIHCGENTTLVKGYKWLNNDLVNLAAGISGSLIILLVFLMN